MDIKVPVKDCDAKPAPEKEVPKYIKSRIVTYTSEQLIERVGPALTCSGSPCPISG
jgi:hypothetical protein